MSQGKLFNLFQNLKTGILGTKSAELDRSIDRSLVSIDKHSSSVDRNVYMDTLKNIVSKTDSNDLSNVVSDIKETQVEFFDRSGRIQRYIEFDSVVRNVAYCSRALEVLTNSIISPDDITKRSLQVLITEQYKQGKTDEDSTLIKEKIETIKKSINIEKYIDKIVRSTLKKGDYFIEILYSPKGQHALTILKEEKEVEKTNQTITIPKTGKYTVIDEGNNLIKNEISGNIIIEFNQSFSSVPGGIGGSSMFRKSSTYSPVHIGDYSKSGNNKSSSPSTSDDDKNLFGSKYSKPPEGQQAEIKDIFITLHNPKYIIRLETERFRSCLGYLVFPKVNMSTLSGRTYSLVNSDIDSICMSIIKQLKDKIDVKSSMFLNHKELRNVVLNYLSSIENDEDLRVRYVPPDMMTHFRINTDIHDPYGESIFECIYFDAKLLQALKTAQTIKRLTSATDKRLISVETGLPHNAKNLVELLKESMKKRKISIDKFGSLDSVPSLISTFEDIYIPQRDGKKFVEIDQMKFGPDPNEDIEGLKFIRDNIVANLGVPPAFVGLEENATNRNLLTAEAVQFARTIIGYQKELNECIHDLFEKIYNLLYPDDDIDALEFVHITFPPPKASMYEHELEYIDNAVRIITTLKEQGIPAQYLKEKYLSFLDWDAIDKYKIDETLDKELGQTKDDDSSGGAGGFGGGY